MYREKERQAASSKGSPGKSAGPSSQERPAQPPAPVAKEPAPVAPPPALQSDLSLSALDFPGMGHEDDLAGDGEDWNQQTSNLIMVGTAHAGMFTVRRYTV
jgi:hypothetical protein